MPSSRPATPGCTTQDSEPPQLWDVLHRLGLDEYLNTLLENGFDTWEIVTDVTEDDLSQLGFKIGHRRALQREIANYRGLPWSLSLDCETQLSSSIIQAPLSELALDTLSKHSSTPNSREKRRYRRHPRADSNAPKKPKTAYVNFADHLRTDPSISSLGFVDIAKEVGKRWQYLPHNEKRIWESYAARAMQEYEAQMDEYRRTDDYRKYQQYLESFKSQQARPKITKRPSAVGSLRRDDSRASPTSSDSPTSTPSSAGSDAELCHNALTLAFSELVSLRGEILSKNIQRYDGHNLPPEDLTRRAIYAFIRGTGSLLFMWTYTQADEILENIYRSDKIADPTTLAECFTVAAMGAHYDVDCFPDRIRQALYASATMQFNEKTARIDYLRTMRLLLSMSFYALLEKHMSARYLVAAGLQIARWKCPALHPYANDEKNDHWRRNYQSLVFMDCWLSYTLGYPSEVTREDISTACTTPASLNIDQAIHIQTSKIGLVAAEISKILSTTKYGDRDTVSYLARKLEIWREEVPPSLQMSSLTSSNPPNLSLYQRRAILMVHIMYLGALVLLYRQLLIASAEVQLMKEGMPDLPIPFEEVLHYRNECVVAAQQMARILSLISFDGTLTKRCWLIIYWAFTACIVLLFGATTKFISGLPNDDVEADLDYAKTCLDMLTPCSQYEAIAAKYMDLLRPIYDSLKDIQQKLIVRAKTSISSLIQPADPATLSPPIPVSKEEIGPIKEKLENLLTDPFGRKKIIEDKSSRRILSSDGSVLVFWWK